MDIRLTNNSTHRPSFVSFLPGGKGDVTPRTRWTRSAGLRRHLVFGLLILCCCQHVAAEDWPTHMRDARRSGVSSVELDFARLMPLWTRNAPAPQRTAWAGPAPWDAYRDDDPLDALRNFDEAPFVTIVGDRVFLGSSVADSAYALNRLTGAVEWVFPTGGPVRFPPTWSGGRVYFGSDDGYVYCLNAADGSLVWKYTPIPEADRRLIGNNGNLIPLWPVRTGVAVADGKVYFASSLVNWKTTYLCAVDAVTGVEQYKVNGGATPMGSIMLSGDQIYLMQGRISPRLYNRLNGAGNGTFGGGADCGAYALVTVDGDLITNYDNRGEFGIKQWNTSTTLLATFSRANNVVADGSNLYVLTDTTLAAMGGGGSSTLWSVASDTPHALVKAGSSLIAGGNNKVVAVDSTTGAQRWEHAVTGRAAGLAVADDTLIVSTDEGHVFAFSMSDTSVGNEGGATAIGGGSATLNGAVSSVSTDTHYLRLYWGETDGGASDSWDHVAPLGTHADGPLSHTVSTLQPDRTYFYRYAVSNSVTAAWVWSSSPGAFITGEVTVSADTPVLSEEAPAPGAFTIRRPAGTAGIALTIPYTVAGSASAGSDYLALSGEAVLKVGETAVQVLVTPIDDLVMNELTEEIRLTLDTGAFINGTPLSATISLVDNDALDPTAFTHQAKISFPGYTLSEPLDGFPALIVFMEGRGGFSYSQCAPDGGDLRFSTALKDQLLSHEIEAWNPGGTSYVWVKVPVLTDTDTFVRAFWGHASQTGAPSNTELTWENGFTGVWHLDEASGTRYDSTSYDRDGVPSGVTAAPGKLLGGLDVNSGQYIDMGLGKDQATRSLMPETEITAEAWVNLDSVVNWAASMGFIQDNGSTEHGWALGTYNSRWYIAIAGGGNGLTYMQSPDAPALNQWVYVAGTYDGSTMRLYVDGQQVASSTAESGPISYMDSWLRLGQYKDDNEDISTDGTLDELRLSAVTRSADWIWATWKNIGDSVDFTAIGDLYADTDRDGMGDGWEQATFGDLATAGEATDWDLDGFSDVSEFRAGTEARSATSYLRLDRVASDGEGIDIQWYAQQGRVYFIEECADPGAGEWQRIAEDIPGEMAMKIIRLNAGPGDACFYKIGLDYDPAE